ncbi:phage tail protein [Vibrio sp. HA2012]|uniref:phage tail protein n=1 Tax=Vibrio sp. HA2012 TaxID=1971595 RepID=UPI000C2C6EE1|nr:phage tail protein [Vibrio sp. HA2012]PJC85313.1 phage tail protein [Vibrio sp. HA2012]
MKKLTLHINGSNVPFYKADLNYSVEQLAHTFNCTIPVMTITQPLPVEFRLDDVLILTGQVDQVQSTTESSSQTVSISGRSKSANMIDSRITMDAIYDQPIDKLLHKLAKPFGLDVRCQVNHSTLSQVPEFQINAESPIENVAQLIREQGLMLIERKGVLTIENTAHATIAGIGLETGNNIENLSITRTFNKQFYRTEVQGAWDDANAVITSSGISNQRTMVIICDQLQSAEACLSRATYERDLAIAESLTASTNIAGLFPELTIDGLNRVIRVIDKQQEFNEMLVIKALGLSVSESSANTSVELFRPFKEQSYA